MFLASYETIGIIGAFNTLLSTILCPIIAGRKGRSVGGWIVGGLLLGLIGLIIVACLPPLNTQTTYHTTTRVQTTNAPQKYCSHCSKIFRTTGAYCPDCGRAFSNTQQISSSSSPAQSKYCYTCHKTIFTSSKYCADCGSELSVVNVNVKTESKMKRCPVCGRVVITSNTVCSNCGGKLVDN